MLACNSCNINTIVLVLFLSFNCEQTFVIENLLCSVVVVLLLQA